MIVTVCDSYYGKINQLNPVHDRVLDLETDPILG